MKKEEFIKLLESQNIKCFINEDDAVVIDLVNKEEDLNDENKIILTIDGVEKIEFPDFISSYHLSIKNKSAKEIIFNNVYIFETNKSRLTIQPNNILEKITFNKKAEMIALELSENNKLNSINIKSSVKGYIKVKKLYINKTNIKEIIGLEDCLMFLDASNSSLEKFDNNVNLIGLYLDGNKKIEEINYSTALLELSVRDSSIKKIHADMENVTYSRLKKLYASNSKLESLQAPNLEVCYVNNTQISKLENMPEIKELDVSSLSGFQFTKELLNTISENEILNLTVDENHKLNISGYFIHCPMDNLDENQKLNISDDKKITDAFILRDNIGQFLFINGVKISAFDDDGLDYILDQELYHIIKQKEAKIGKNKLQESNYIIDRNKLLDSYLEARGASEAQKAVFWQDVSSIKKISKNDLMLRDKLYNESIISYCPSDSYLAVIFGLGYKLSDTDLESIKDPKIKRLCEAFSLRTSYLYT